MQVSLSHKLTMLSSQIFNKLLNGFVIPFGKLLLKLCEKGSEFGDRASTNRRGRRGKGKGHNR